ncbi:uncharacterized protein At4g22758-like [Diospyros lotus]|uniref:uncharacterized protein At4g22758-like n=1 Tax=Diospyros lotus TaxID=55363 RepID=UPI00224E0A40|nr:uncharacterized protein At4g22758-like [Diospyros lotus]
MKGSSVSEKMMGHKQQQEKKKKKSFDQSSRQVSKKNRFLITVNVLGSAGPIRFVVNEDDHVSAVIDTALKIYGREGRLPVLGSEASGFLLYPVNAGSDALNPSESIGLSGARNFILCKKQIQPQMTEARSEMIAQKRSSSWKSWLNKSFNFNILSH